jgi:hypothetical protein
MSLEPSAIYELPTGMIVYTHKKQQNLAKASGKELETESTYRIKVTYNSKFNQCVITHED